MVVWVFMFFMLSMDKGLLGPVWNGGLWLVVRLRHWAEQWPNDDLQLCSSSCALRCQHGLELLGQWLEPCMALVWFLEVWCASTFVNSSTWWHINNFNLLDFLLSPQENGCQHIMENGTICFFGRTKD
uniref:Candidate secreted effector n=1 Tax=Meloidogyne incognita TaxID=6306 RepID=A0A914M4A2_MELIC